MKPRIEQALLFSHEADKAAHFALEHGGRRFTYAELGAEARRQAARLRGAGVGPGDRVVILLPNSPELVTAVFAVLLLGAVVVPLDPGSGPARRRFVTAETTPAATIGGDGEPFAPGVPHLTLAQDADGPVSAPFPPGAEERAAIFFSSGSTGEPKGVVLRHSHLLATARNLRSASEMEPGHRELLLSPLNHTDGWQRAAATWLGGGCVVLFSGPLTVPTVLEALRDLRIDGFYCPPPLVRLLARTDASRLHEHSGRCRCVEIGSAAFSAEEIGALMTGFPAAKVLVHFGLTESSRATILDCRRAPGKLHTVGQAAPGVRVEVHAPPGQPGEIRLRGEQCADEYWNRPALTRERFVNGWLRTGDFGRLDDEGFLTYLGREDEMMNSGGHHFYPAEIELELAGLPGVRELVIAPLPDPAGLRGQVPALFVVPASEPGVDVPEILRLCRERLPGHLVPKKVIRVPEIPRTSSGKPARRELAAKWGREGGSDA